MSAQRQQSRNHRARPSRLLALAAALLSCAGLGACNWAGSLPEIAPSVEALADALAAAAGTTTTEPREVTVGDISGVEFDLSVESGVMLPDCTEDHVCIHSEVASHCTRYYHESESQNETYRVLDLDGDRAVLAVGEWTAGVDPALVDEARAVFDSITFVKSD